MEYYAGIDVSLEQSSVCIVDGTGSIVAEAKVGFIAGTQDRSDRTEGHCPGRAPGEMVEVEGRQT